MKEAARHAAEQARSMHHSGDGEGALDLYRRMEETARRDDDREALLHALRHVALLSIERGGNLEAREAAGEAVALARAQARGLDLANALRLLALAGGEPSVALWREARDLYAAQGVAEGAAECEARLARP